MTSSNDDNKSSKNCRMLKIDCDVRVLLITLVCTGIGASLVASSSSFFAGGHFSDQFALLRKHIFKIGVALFMLILAMKIDYTNYRKASPVFLFVGICLLVAVFLVPGSIRSSDRWIYFTRLQIAVQPSEFTRLALVFFLAWWIARTGKKMSEFKKGFLPAITAVSVVVCLVAAAPNYGSATATLVIALTMLFLGGAKLLHLTGFVTLCAGIGAIKMWQAPYVRARIDAFLNPSEAVTEVNWQVHQSLIGLGSGGLFGRGWGKSTQKLSWLPDSFTDFIFAILGEETGLVGTVLVSAMFLLLALRALKISRGCNDVFGEMLVLGIGCTIFWYAALNMYVATGLFPVTGLPLPFLSYGGSALVVNSFAIGVLLNISRGKSERKKRRRKWLAPAVGEV